MTSDAAITILNVGHGNATLVRDGKNTILVDTGGEHAGLKVLEHLRNEGVHEITALLLSHADEDHIGSAPTILLATDIQVHMVFLNTDTSKRTKAFEDLRVALRVARKERNTKIISSLTITQSDQIPTGTLTAHVLYPSPETALAGPGGRDVDSAAVTTNSMSAVIRFSHPSGHSLILPADCDQCALDFWHSERIDIESTIVVFPHHGGRPGTFDPGNFAERFTELSKPHYVVFSIHLTKHSLPRDEVLAAIQRRAPNAKLVCTQLPDRVKELCDRHPWTLHSEGGHFVQQAVVHIDLAIGQVRLKMNSAQ